MAVFKNFFFVFIIVGVLTRISNHYFAKLVPKTLVLHLSHITCGIIVCSLAVKVVGFDVAIAEYVISFIVWYIFDLSREKD